MKRVFLLLGATLLFPLGESVTASATEVQI